jgi:hypothetical protein
MYGIRPEVREVTASCVLVAYVELSRGNVEARVVEVAVRYSATVWPATESFAYGELVPIPSRLFTLSKKKFALSSESNPPAPINGTEPAVSPLIVRFVVVALVATRFVSVEVPATKFPAYRFVLVALVVVALVAVRFVNAPVRAVRNDE